MSVDQMRKAIIDVYPGTSWLNRVYRMGDNQIIAIYYKFKKEGKFDKVKPQKSPGENFHQMTIYDYISDLRKGENVK